MNYGRAFSFVTQDPDWFKKVIIAALVLLIPVVGSFAFMGWGLEINRRVSSGETELLPEWNDFGGFIILGLKELVVTLVYMLPTLLVYGCGMAAFLGIGAATGGSSDSSNGDAMASVLLGTMGCMYCFMFLFAITGALLLAPASSVLAETGEISAALRFGHIFGLLRSAIGPYILSLLLLGLAASVASSIGSIACGVGALFAAGYMRAVGSHLYAQAYKIAKGTLAPSPDAAPM